MPRVRNRMVLVGLALALAPAAVAACGGGEEAAPPAEPPAPPAAPEGDATAGADVWTSAGCGSCHTLAAAGSTGTVGPNLDDAKPDFDLVVNRVEVGGGGMPSFKDQLSEQEIKDVAAYVVESTSG